MSLPPAPTLPSLPPSQRTSILDLLFEPSPDLHALALPLLDAPFESYDALAAAVGARLTELAASPAPDDRRALEGILGSHPRLGEKKVDSEQSRAEQARLNQGGEGEAEVLRALNEEYEKTFPGLRYV